MNILFCTYICTLGTRNSGNFNNVLTSTKVLLLVVIMSFSYAYTNWAFVETITSPKHGLEGVVDGATYVFIGYMGFDLLSLYSSETKDPESVIPSSIMMSQLIVFVVYIVNSVSMVGIGMHNVAVGKDAEIAYALSFQKLGLNSMAVVIYLTSILGTIVCNLTGMLTLIRMLQSLANDGFIFEIFKEIDQSRNVPVKGSWLASIPVCCICFFLDLSEVTKLSTMCTLLLFAYMSIVYMQLCLRDQESGFEPDNQENLG